MKLYGRYSIDRQPFHRGQMMKYSIVFIGLLAFSQLVFSNTVKYVHSEKAKLLQQPTYKALVLENMPRGTQLQVIENTGRWTKVVNGEYTGWVSSMLISASQPAKTKSVLTGHNKQLEKTSRRRASNNTTAAATRGLRQNKNSRASTQSNADYNALQDVESSAVKSEDAWKFHGQIKQPE